MKFVAITGTPDAKQKRCYDCGYISAAVDLYCTQEDAIAARGTRFFDGGGVHACPYWKPCLVIEDFSWWERLWLGLSSDYIKTDL